jgi:CheY-like chemotaxis protein
MDAYINQFHFYILIVDDNKDDQFFLRKAISKVMPQTIIESLYDGSEALNFLKACTSLPNLIFLDLNMASISGKDTIKEIRSNESLNKVPIVVLTTNNYSIETETLLKMGANAFYTKPNKPDDLVAIVEDVTEKWPL